MMNDANPPGAPRTAPRTGPPGSGYVTLGTFIVAAASALLLVTLSGCHPEPGPNAFATTTTDKAVEARLRRPDPMKPIQPFDEGFVTTVDEP